MAAMVDYYNRIKLTDPRPGRTHPKLFQTLV